MSTQTRLIIFAFLVVATALETSGDAIIRNGLSQKGMGAMAIYFGGGALLLFGYGLSLNLAPIEFHRVVGIYIATLFVMWQLVSFLFFRTVPNLPIILGGALIVAGGLLVAFWEQPAQAGA